MSRRGEKSINNAMKPSNLLNEDNIYSQKRSLRGKCCQESE